MTVNRLTIVTVSKPTKQFRINRVCDGVHGSIAEYKIAGLRMGNPKLTCSQRMRRRVLVAW